MIEIHKRESDFLNKKSRTKHLYLNQICDVCVLKWGPDWWYFACVCMRVCSSSMFALGRALIKAESDRERLNERDAPVFQLLDKHGVNTVSSNITITVWLWDKNRQRKSTDTKGDWMDCLWVNSINHRSVCEVSFIHWPLTAVVHNTACLFRYYYYYYLIAGIHCFTNYPKW